jgi:histidinol-phosphate phosphatase family protein
MRSNLTAVFLDRDGVINRKAAEGEYVTSWQEFEFLPSALEGLRILANSQLSILVATNQRGIALGRMTVDDLDDIHRHMLASVSAAGGRIDAVYYCPHDVGCRCRKPEVGMFERAAGELGLRFSDAAVVGDSPSDMLAAARIGATRVMVGARHFDVDYRAVDLIDAARWLLRRSDRG